MLKSGHKFSGVRFVRVATLHIEGSEAYSGQTQIWVGTYIVSVRKPVIITNMYFPL
jgi:hypothetical protein